MCPLDDATTKLPPDRTYDARHISISSYRLTPFAELCSVSSAQQIYADLAAVRVKQEEAKQAEHVSWKKRKKDIKHQTLKGGFLDTLVATNAQTERWGASSVVQATRLYVNSMGKNVCGVILKYTQGPDGEV